MLEQRLCTFPATEIKQSAGAVLPVEGWRKHWKTLESQRGIAGSGRLLCQEVRCRGTAQIPPGRTATVPEQRSLQVSSSPCLMLLNFS